MSRLLELGFVVDPALVKVAGLVLSLLDELGHLLIVGCLQRHSALLVQTVS